MTLPPRTSSSPSSPRRTSTPGIGRPIDGAWWSSMGTTVAEPVRRDRSRYGALHHLPLALVRLGGDPGLQAGHQLLPDARHADEKGGPRFDEKRKQLVRVRAQPHLVSVLDASPLRREAFGNVCEGQVADQRLRLDGPEALHGFERPHDVVVRVHDTLGWPGGA